MREVESIDAEALTGEAFQRYVDEKRAVLVRGVDCWPEGGAPSLESIRRLSRDPLVKEKSFWSGDGFAKGLPLDWTFADYVANLLDGTLPEIKDGERPYLVGLTMRSSAALGPFGEGFRAPAFLPPNVLARGGALAFQDLVHADVLGLELFIGGPDAPRAFPLHVDSMQVDVFTCGTVGLKQFVLFPPETPHELLYIDPRWCGVTGLLRFSAIPLLSDLENPDPTAFPRFDEALRKWAIVARIEPGCLLYMPANWWHAAHNLRPTVTVSWRNISGARRAGAAVSAALQTGLWHVRNWVTRGHAPPRPLR